MSSSMETTPRQREEELPAEEGRVVKRIKLIPREDSAQDATGAGAAAEPTVPIIKIEADVEPQPRYIFEDLLPPSRSLIFPAPLPAPADDAYRVLEVDVGISEYIGKDVPAIQGIIKQRFTDFLVFEVEPEGKVVRLKSIGKPDDPHAKKAEDAKKEEESTLEGTQDAPVTEDSKETTADASSKDAATFELTGATDTTAPAPPPKEENKPWPDSFTTTLAPFFSTEALENLKEMFLQGPEPPFVSDGGWGARGIKKEGDSEAVEEKESEEKVPEDSSLPVTFGNGRGSRGGRGRDRGGRGGRGGRGRGRGGARGTTREDHRKVDSEPISSKTDRTTLHQAVRELFKGKLESTMSEEGSRVVIRWGRGGRGSGRGGRGKGKDSRPPRDPNRPYIPPFIHFTMQKTNRDTQDALAHLSRLLRVPVRDLTVAGTKDKRGVTVQRVCFKRGNKMLMDVWRSVNTLGPRRSNEQVMKERGERGVRIADLVYRKGSLELGMLKGNAFVITLRNVKAESEEVLNRAMETIKNKGFINYYGMQRFGTSSIPTHSIGLAILRSDWQRAVELLLRPRPGENPECEAARRAWLEDGDLQRALDLFPRRVVAERCILESFQKMGGDSRNAMGALSTIPRNLRLMYVHAYQSYVWNAVVSERIRLHGADKPVVGDLVYEKVTDDEEAAKPEHEDVKDESTDAPEDAAVDIKPDESLPEPTVTDEPAVAPSGESSALTKKKGKKQWVQPRVKVLTEADVDQYTIFDVLMPLPGKDVSYPGGDFGEKYREFLRLDGLDPDNFVRKQKEYTLGGSYRKILHKPSELSWSILRYTDPDVPLAQSDEDQLLGFDAPVTDESGRFMALQIRLTLGTAAYATMALREVTKTETSSHFQTTLTKASEDQQYKGTADAELGDADGEGELEEVAAQDALETEQPGEEVAGRDVKMEEA
ncbi:hypothetical protein BOTBODRAFT_50816 [Botryobasidium botryosum FD-172 SS1]|uniref:TRUD domain-containing protein n=1 Tax=Botryobasidium botryosum (strain FD-172 SS1) TaxID=930990 RepID=A0A067NAE9_BOTB1|nr:hypothetical protein BOTBODRAFT_50816 [Botryobasidium botryosum FD-172 SS1]